jgi:hypothetical protein
VPDHGHAVVQEVRDNELSRLPRLHRPPVAHDFHDGIARIDVKPVVTAAFECHAAVLAGTVQVEHFSTECFVQQRPLCVAEFLGRAEDARHRNGGEAFALDEAGKLLHRIRIAIEDLGPERVQPAVIVEHLGARHHRATEHFFGAGVRADPSLHRTGDSGRHQIGMGAPHQRPLVARPVSTPLQHAPLPAESRSDALLVAIERCMSSGCSAGVIAEQDAVGECA